MQPHYKNKKITIIGMGKSGIASAQKLLDLGARITISEKHDREECDPQVIDRLKEQGVVFEFGGHSMQVISGRDFIVISPGAHLDLPIIKEAQKNHILVISEVELAYRFLNKPIIAITGTNGKTTTSTLIAKMLAGGGLRVALAGNIGIPLITVNDRNLDFIVAEISSYQLETIVSFRPWISVLLNITPDHMERHNTMEEYARAKARIFLNQGKTDYIVYNISDPLIRKIIQSSAARLIPFDTKDIFFDPSTIKIKGAHNLENIMAASVAAQLCGVGRESIKKTLVEFQGVPHRIEFIREIGGVSFYNDSKATNPDSTIAALQALAQTSHKRNIILILGGKDKGTSLNTMVEEIKKSAKAVVLIGAAVIRFNNELIKAGFKDIHFAHTIPEAVAVSREIGSQTDQVLLSPACASFDMFLSFEERGDVFRQAVLDLKE